MFNILLVFVVLFELWLHVWVFFGNEEDSIKGGLKWNPEQKGGPIIWARWWLRNPFHNLMFHVLGLPRVFWMKSWPSRTDSGPWLWPAADTGWQFALYNYVFPLLSFRTTKWEGYLGWRGSSLNKNAKLGAAFRKR